MHDEPSIKVMREIILQWRLGARAAAVIARAATRYKSSIEVSHAGYNTGDAKSIMDVLLLPAAARPEDVTRDFGGIHLKAGAKIRIIACGTDAVAAVEAIEREFLNAEWDFDRRAEPRHTLKYDRSKTRGRHGS